MPAPEVRPVRGVVPMLLVGLVVVAVASGLAQGFRLSNAHNGLLGLSCTFVGAYVLHQRPGHREGLLLLSAGVVEALMFLGRQVAHGPGSEARWWGWLGVWPLALGLGLTTLAVIGFPDGRLPGPRWRIPVAGVVLVAVAGSLASALWPVEYDATGVLAPHPLDVPGAGVASSVWSALAHPAYAVLQVLWVVAVLDRWRRAGGHVRRQLAVLALPVALAAGALLVGLAGWRSATPGLLAATLVPIGAGWAVVHGQQVAAYSALSWLSRSGRQGADLPTALARALAEAVDGTSAVLWVGPADDLRAVGVWPETPADVPPTTLDALHRHHGRLVESGRTPVGAVSVDQDRPLTRSEERLLDDLAAQAALVVEHIGLAELAAQQPPPARLGTLTPREESVLALMAQGLSNPAIAGQLHLSVKTVEPVVSAIFAKLGLHADAASNRRVLAVLAYWRH